MLTGDMRGQVGCRIYKRIAFESHRRDLKVSYKVQSRCEYYIRHLFMSLFDARQCKNLIFGPICYFVDVCMCGLRIFCCRAPRTSCNELKKRARTPRARPGFFMSEESRRGNTVGPTGK